MAQWNKEQNQVIKSRNCNLLVSAAAGSGKTAVLVERILEMVMDEKNPCDITDFLVVTFTNAAASQMREKIAAKIEKAVSENPGNSHLVKQLSLINRADITTIDSFCLKVVKENFNYIGIDSAFSIVDEKIMEIVKDDVLNEIFDELCDKEENGAFKDLARAFSNKHKLDSIKKNVLDICKTATSNSDVNKWLNSAKEAAHIENENDLNNAGWIKALVMDIKKQAADACEKARAAEEIFKSPYGCGKNDEVYNDDMNIINNIIKADNYTEIYKASNVNIKRISAIRKEGPEKENYVKFKEIRESYINPIKEIVKKAAAPESIIKEMKNAAKWTDAIIDICIIYLERLAEEKNKKKQYEFSDISHMALKILCEKDGESDRVKPTRIAKNISRRYKEIFIDEYQDSNFIQEDILTSVSKENEGIHNMFMVGDVKQSIYRFRMARPDLFIDKFNTYTESDEGNCDYRLINLKTNYRSRKVVLDSVNYIFEKIMHSNLGDIEYDEKAALKYGELYLDTTENISKSSEIMLVVNEASDTENSESKENSEDENEELENIAYEAAMVANRIKELVDKEKGLTVWDDDKKTYRKATYRDCAILLRSIKGKANVFAKALEQAGIPVSVDNPSGYFDAVEVVTILSMLKVIDNVRQDIPLAAVLISPLADIDNNDMALIAATELKEDINNPTFYDKCKQYLLDEQRKEEICDKLKKIFGIIEELKALKPFVSISELIEKILSKTHYDIYISALSQGKKRIANINMLMEKAKEFEQGTSSSLFNFLRYMEKIRIHDVDFGEAKTLSSNEDVVQITSMHKSKGLEYPIVFVSGLGQKFNEEYKKNKILIHSDYYLATRYINPDKMIERKSFIKETMNRLTELDNLAEEQRILYVAMTRAREKLILTGYINKIPEKTDLDYAQRSRIHKYLDWIMPCINLDEKEDYFEKIYINKNDVLIDKIEKEIKKADSYNELVDKIGSINVKKEEKEIRDTYEFEYPYEEATMRKVKTSISEIKKMKMYAVEEENEEVHSFVKKIEKGTAGALRGTVIHKIMELLPFSKINNKQEMISCVNDILNMDLFDEEEKNITGIEQVYDFYDTELFTRMKHADINGLLMKEKQFTIGIPANKIYPDIKDKDIVIVQGIVDVFFYEDEDIILMDYKTDNVKTAENLIERYKVQLDYYAETLERLTGKTVKEKLIYSFNLGKTIDC